MNDDTAILTPIPVGEPGADDGLAAELAKAAPRRWWNRGTVLLVGIVLLVGGFATGLQVQKSYGTETPAAAGGNRLPGGQNRGGFPGAAPGGAPGATASTAAAAATTGTVKLVNGTTIYVETATGDVVTIKTDAKTAVATAQAGKLADVKAGQSVTVHGKAGTDGTVTATSVTTQAK